MCWVSGAGVDIANDEIKEINNMKSLASQLILCSTNKIASNNKHGRAQHVKREIPKVLNSKKLRCSSSLYRNAGAFHFYRNFPYETFRLFLVLGGSMDEFHEPIDYYFSYRSISFFSFFIVALQLHIFLFVLKVVLKGQPTSTYVCVLFAVQATEPISIREFSTHTHTAHMWLWCVPSSHGSHVSPCRYDVSLILVINIQNSVSNWWGL